MLFPLLLSSAHAFCGYYAGEAGANLYNQLSQIAMVRQGSRTTLTLANDVAGDAAEFALIIPVPEVLDEADVRLADPALFAVLDDYSAPRLVEYTCESLYADYALAEASGMGGGGSVPPTEPVGAAESSVSVEAEFAVGEYEIVILSADESGDLLTWLDDNDYAIGDDAADLLGEYIDSGSYFFAAKVALELLPGEGVTLSPLQFSYDADMFALPIRLGTLNSPGSQDLLLYALTDAAEGSVAIANYPEVEIEDECLWDGDAEGFAAFYPEAFGDAIEEAGGSAWMEEYSWSPYKCDPCVGEPPTEEEIDQLGFDGPLEDAHFTRLHMRYDSTADADLTLYTTRITDWEQIRFVTWTEEIEYLYPVCGAGFVEDPGECPGGYTWTEPGLFARWFGGGCSTAPGGSGALAVVLAGVLIGWRRRSISA